MRLISKGALFLPMYLTSLIPLSLGRGTYSDVLVACEARACRGHSGTWDYTRIHFSHGDGLLGHYTARLWASLRHKQPQQALLLQDGPRGGRSNRADTQLQRDPCGADGGRLRLLSWRARRPGPW